MGSWDELCLLCGICGGGPSHLLSAHSLEKYAQQIASEIAAGKGGEEDSKLFAIVKDALAATFSTSSLHRRSWLPDGVGADGAVTADPEHYTTWRNVAVGYFDEESGEGRAPMREDRLVPDGKLVQVRQVVDGNSGDFSSVVCSVVTPNGKAIEVQREVPSMCSVVHGFHPNIALCERCYYYLKSWLNTENMPAPADGHNLPFAGELYEIVSSRKEERDRDTALLPCLDYGGIQKSLEQWQSFYMPCRRGTKHVSRAIDAGLRGADLVPALLRDCRVWMFMRPDIWPTPSQENETWRFSPLKPQNSTDPELNSRLTALPNELLLSIFRDLSLLDLLSLSATCRSLRTLITDPAVLNSVLRELILFGSLRWILPVRGLLKEEESAYEALKTWLPGSDYDVGRHERKAQEQARRDDKNQDDRGDDEDVGEFSDEEELPIEFRAPNTYPWYYVRPIHPAPSIPPIESLFSSQFPYLRFLHACWESDSMMNRRRLWDMVKQFDGLWREYRLHGWEVNRFFPAEEILDKLQSNEVGCKPLCER